MLDGLFLLQPKVHTPKIPALAVTITTVHCLRELKNNIWLS